MKSTQQTCQPNILLIVMDATRADHLSCYGYQRETTPTLDKIAAKGVLYDQCISPAVWTLASMASMFTGLYVSQHNTTIRHQYLEPQFITVAEVLRGYGYQTALFSAGGWVGETFGTSRGFITFHNYVDGIHWMRRLSKKATRVEKLLRWGKRYLVGSRQGKKTYQIARDLHHWFEQDRQPDRPFFAVAHFGDPHWPWFYHPPFSWRDGRQKCPRVFAPDGTRFVAGVLDLTAEELKMMVDYYDGEVSFLDHSIGMMLDGLEKSGHLENTLIIITADHGEHLGEHHLMGHELSVYEGLLRVPLILYHPEHFAGGERVSEPVQTLDLFPTILNMSHIDRDAVPNHLLGRNLQPDEVRTEPRPFTIAEYLGPNLRRLRRVCTNVDITPFDRQLRALRMHDTQYKLIWSSTGRYELYDLAQDPGETKNLADIEPGRVQKLHRQLDAWLATLDATELNPLEPEMEQTIIERLRDLGYF